jgi:hypothetical protein
MWSVKADWMPGAQSIKFPTKGFENDTPHPERTFNFGFLRQNEYNPHEKFRRNKRCIGVFALVL